MALTGHVTAEQLGTVVQAIMDKVPTIREDDTGEVVNFDKFAIAYQNDTGNIYINNFKSQTLGIILGSEPGSYRVVTTTQEGTLSLNTLEIGTFKNIGVEGNKQLDYCLPDAAQEARTKAMHPTTGGGSLLTTRRRGYEKIEYSASGRNEEINATINPFYFYYIHGSSNINLTFVGVPTEVNEYWVDITFADLTPSITFEGETLVWPDGEPDWSTMAGARIQLHIMNGMVWFVKHVESTHGDPEPIDPGLTPIVGN